jgi:hypothetical protein
MTAALFLHRPRAGWLNKSLEKAANGFLLGSTLMLADGDSTPATRRLMVRQIKTG